MFSGEDPATWKYFDHAVKGEGAMGRKLPYYVDPYGIDQKRPDAKDGVYTYAPVARLEVQQAIHQGAGRNRKVGLTTNVNQTGATLTSVAVIISITGVRTCSPNLCSREDVNCIQSCPGCTLCDGV